MSTHNASVQNQVIYESGGALQVFMNCQCPHAWYCADTSEQENQMDIEQREKSIRKGVREEQEKCICVCDSEEVYARHLAEYLHSRGQLPYEIHLYFSCGKFLESERPGQVAVLVIAESQYSRKVEDAGFSSVLLLSETETYREEPENMSKYQSVENIAARIAGMCSRDPDGLPQSLRHGNPMKLIGVYSPIARCLQTTFALTLGQILAEKERTLYLNFEAYSGLEIMLDRSFRGSVSDLLYYNECAREKMAGQLGLMTEKMGKLEFLPPMESWIQLHAIRGEQWMDLFRTLEKVSEYACCILDLSEHADGVLEILRQCDLVCTITREDGFSQAKLRQYEELLRSTQYEDIFMKTRRCQLPVFRELPANPEMLTRGELFLYVREFAVREGLL